MKTTIEFTMAEANHLLGAEVVKRCDLEPGWYEIESKSKGEWSDEEKCYVLKSLSITVERKERD